MFSISKYAVKIIWIELGELLLLLFSFLSDCFFYRTQRFRHFVLILFFLTESFFIKVIRISSAKSFLVEVTITIFAIIINC